MSGILMTAATLKTSAAPPPAPLAASYNWTGGDTYNVTGASGRLSDIGYNIFGGGPTGGVPPYTESGLYLTDVAGPGSLTVAASGDGTHNTLAWAGLNVGEGMVCVLNSDVTDSAGHHASWQYPDQGVLVVRRVS